MRSFFKSVAATIVALAVAFALVPVPRVALATVLSNPSLPTSYACDGTTTIFSVQFPYGAPSDLVVTATTAAGAVTTLNYTTDFTLNVVSTQTTATLTLTAGSKCPSGSILKIGRATPLTQPVHLQLPYSPPAVESMFDRLTRQVQEGAGNSPNSLLVGKGSLLTRSNSSVTSFPLGSSGQVLTVDPNSSTGFSWGSGFTALGSYTASGTGAVPITIPRKLGETVSVKDFGAVGDGTTDDATTINAALIAAAGKTVRFPSGSYGIGAFLSPAANTVMVCDGTCTLQPVNAYASYAIQVRANGITIRGFSFSGFLYGLDANSISDLVVEGNKFLSSTTTGLGLISSSSKIRVLDNWIDSAVGISLGMHSVTDVIVRGNLITNSGDDCIAVRTLTGAFNTDVAVIAGNVLDDCGKVGIKYTVETSSLAGSTVQRASITGNTIKKWGRNVAEAAISVNNLLSDGSLNQNITISGNSIESANRTLENTYISAINTKDVAITGNTMRGGVNASGIVVQGAQYVNITGNIVADAVKVSAATNIGGITVLTSKYGSITANTIRNPGAAGNHRPGIYVEQSQDFSIVANVTVDDQGAGATMSNGIEMNSNGATKNDFNTLVGNLSTGHLVSGLLFNSAALAQHQTAIGNHDGASGGITFFGTAAAKTSGVRNASTRNIIRNASVAPVDCAGAGITATVTQMLDGGIFTCGTAQTLTTARADGTSGIVQALPGIPAVGDVFQFFMSSTAAANFTLAAGLSVTLVGNVIVNNSSRVVICRITSVTLNSETVTCYV